MKNANKVATKTGFFSDMYYLAALVVRWMDRNSWSWLVAAALLGMCANNIANGIAAFFDMVLG